MMFFGSYQPKLSHVFPVILIGAAMVYSLFANSFMTPMVNFDYFDELQVMQSGKSHSRWIHNTALPHADKLTPLEIESFTKIAEGKQYGANRDIYIGQALSERQSRECAAGQYKCRIDISLNRTLEPNYIHGDLRLVSLIETSLVHNLETSPDSFKKLGSQTQRRQLRFLLTEHGWVQTTSEILEPNPFAAKPTRKVLNSKFSGLNYYPRSAPWDEFWEEYPRDEIIEDMDYMKFLGVNSLRIFVNHAYFTDAQTSTEGLEKLADFLNLCADHDLKVIVTMFDLWADYRLGNWAKDAAHIHDVIDAIGHHEALLAIDIKNEPDLDFNRVGHEQVNAWLDAMIDSLRYVKADIPLTIGWSDPSHAELLSGKLDIISYHDYKPAKTIGKRLEEVKDKVGDKPVYLTEIGSSRWALIGDKKTHQAGKLHTQLTNLKDADGIMVWTLHDFENVSSNVVGHRPWRQAQQKKYGLIGKDLALLPSGVTFKRFNKHFNPSTES
jgi:hypothetical protein